MTSGQASNSRPLSLAHLSIIAASPVAFMEFAARAGFDLVDLRLSPATTTDRLYTNDERLALCRALLPVMRDLGLRVWDVEIVRITAQTRPEDYLGLMEAAALLGAKRMKIVCDSDDAGFAAGMLAQLCRLAAPFGLTLDLEYMVFSGVKSLRQAMTIAAAADQPNLKVLVDALHWMRAADAMAAPRPADMAYLGYVQLCDGPLQGPSGREALILEARTNRLVPGSGEFPLTQLLEFMPPQCVVSVEVPLPPGRDPLAHARSLCQATQRLVEGTASS